MSKRDNFKNIVRDTLIASSNVRPSASPSINAVRTVDRAESMAQAIAARRNDLNIKTTVGNKER